MQCDGSSEVSEVYNSKFTLLYYYRFIFHGFDFLWCIE